MLLVQPQMDIDGVDTDDADDTREIFREMQVELVDNDVLYMAIDVIKKAGTLAFTSGQPGVALHQAMRLCILCLEECNTNTQEQEEREQTKTNWERVGLQHLGPDRIDQTSVKWMKISQNRTRKSRVE